MRRRDVLALGGSFIGSLAAGKVLAATDRSLPRAAVAIGVNKAGNLPALSAAASGALQVGRWLESENFDVKVFVDDANPVLFNDVFETIHDLVENKSLGQLVIYFAGHGFAIGDSEVWMLSKAPKNPNEAIGLVGSIAFARESQIPNIVFVSDACRSPAGSFGTGLLHGGEIFPFREGRHVPRPDIDLFFATLPGDPALEAPIEASSSVYEGIYTTCFLNAFKQPDVEMVLDLADGEKVIPNKNLKAYLEREVQARSQEISLQVNQITDSRIESDEKTFIGRVLSASTLPSPTPEPTKASILDVVRVEIGRVASISAFPPDIEGTDVDEVAVETGFVSERNTILQTLNPKGFSSGTGYAIYGRSIRRLVGSSNLNAEVISHGNGATEPALIRVDSNDGLAGSVAVLFEDGTGTVIAAIPGFEANCLVNEEGVSNVSYVPSQDSSRWFAYQDVRERLDALRATVAAGAKLGAFRLEGERSEREAKAGEIADVIRVEKGLDPTLGLYAAYAYAAADIIEQVQSVDSFISGDLGVSLFDVAMLAGRLVGRPIDRGVVPFCPMLSQGWGLLRANRVELPGVVARAGADLRPALWTTFGPAGMDIIVTAMRNGELQ
jgi:hypothetical protein